MSVFHFFQMFSLVNKRLSIGQENSLQIWHCDEIISCIAQGRHRLWLSVVVMRGREYYIIMLYSRCNMSRDTARLLCYFNWAFRDFV